MRQRASFQVIECAESLSLFRKETARRIHVNLPLEYLRRSRVVALISSDRKQIYGGFVIADNGPLRSLEQLPDGCVEANPYLKKRQAASFEVNGFWLSHSDAHAFSCFALYAVCFAHCLRQAMRGKFYFIYAYDAQSSHLDAFFSSFYSVRLYKGQVKALPGMKGPAEEIVEICSIWRLVLSALVSPGFVFKRLRFRKKTEDKHVR